MGRSVSAHAHAPGRGGLTWKSCRNTVLWLAILLLLPVCGAEAQVSNAGRITGTVVDPSGAAIPGALVTATQPSTGFSQTVKANSSGVYVFADLEPGTYDLEATAKGFSKAVYHTMAVKVAQTTNLQIKMTIGGARQTVTVSAQAQILQTTSSTIATTISPEMIENLPLNGRDLLQFASIVPGAANPEGTALRYTTYNGLPNAAVNIAVNGTQDQFLRYKTFSSSFFPPAPLREGAFSEATVSTTGLGSDSAAGASQIQFATKRGTSHFHGRAFWQAENSFFNANTWYDNAHGYPNPKYRNNYFGGNIGGPLWPRGFLKGHRAYFFVNLEYHRSPFAYVTYNNTLTQNAAKGLYTYEVSSIPSSPPSWVTKCSAAAMTCTANLYALAQAKGYPASEDGTVKNILAGVSSFYPKGTLQPLATSQSALYADNALYLQQLVFRQSGTTREWYPTTRLDMDITPKIHWSDSWDLYWRDIPGTPAWPGSPYIGNYSGFKSTYYTWSNSVRWTISPTMINTASFGIMSTVEEFSPGADSTAFSHFLVDGEPSQVFMPSGFGIPTLIPSIDVPVPRNNPLWNPSDTLRWTHGNHSFYIGGDLIYANMHEAQVTYPVVPGYSTGIASGDPAAGMFDLSNFPGMNNSSSPYTGLTAQQAAENLYGFLSGRVTSVSGGSELNPATGQFQPGIALEAWEAKTYGGLYFQDSWQTTPHLTLNYGLRWEFTGAIHNPTNNYFAPTFQNLLGPSATLFTPGQLNGIQNPYIAINPNPYHGDFVQPAPNLGFAWNPDFESGFLGKLLGRNETVVRGSFSINWYDPGWETFENATIYTNPGNFQTLFYSSSAGMFTPGSQTLSTPGIYNRIAASGTPPSFQQADPMSLWTFSGQNFGTVDPNIKYPYVENWFFGIERELPGNFVVNVNYVGNHGVHGWQNFNLNEINTLNNGFAGEFKSAMGNYKINSAHGLDSFADNTGYNGVVATPIFDAAFNGNGVSTNPSDPGGYANSGFLYDLSTGQAGAMASAMAGTYSYLCNMVGAHFSPCGNTGGNYPINFFEANPYAAGAQVINLSDPFSSTYNALQISVRHPVGHGLQLGANYSFSKSLGSRFQSYYTDTGQVNYISLRNMRLNKGPSDFDIRHVLHAYFTYNLPVGKGRHFGVSNPFLNAVVGGWNVGSIITAQSGLPFWLQGGYQTFNAQDGGVVLSGVNRSQIQNNIGVYLTPSSPYSPVWINPKFNATGKILPNTTPGTIGQVLFLHGPMFFNTDISINKVFPIHENLGLKIQASFLNAFNHPNWIVGRNYNAPGYIAYASSSLSQPSATYAGNPRVVQFRMEVDF